MDKQERIRLLSRLGRETVIKYGTYDMNNARPIIQDHPFYQQTTKEPELEVMEDADYNDVYEEEPVYESEPELAADNEPISDDDAAALAAEIMGSNFKSKMSQDDVDAILNGLL